MHVCVCVCVCVCFHIILYVNCFGRTVLYMCIEYHISVTMYHVSTQGVDECMINVHYYYHLVPCVTGSPFQEAVWFQQEPQYIRSPGSFWNFVRNAFVTKELVITIFFGFGKAYDTTWKYSILADLWDLGFWGHLPMFIQNFLSERSFRVTVGSTLSELHQQEIGVLPGSILLSSPIQHQN